MSKLQKLPVSESGFEALRLEGMLYVDKTKQMLTLLEQGRYLFLSRPRRFGKSLLITTLKALYEGKKHLFEGLYIYEHWNWVEYPVIRLDFSTLIYRKDKATFERSIRMALKETAQYYNITLIEEKEVEWQLNELLLKLNQKLGRKVVVLIDEYDKPITDFIHHLAKATENRELLHTFYTHLKGKHELLEKVLITGVSKLAKVAVFSGLNNAIDVSLLDQLQDIVGLTQTDVEHYFAPYLQTLQTKFQLSPTLLLEAIRHWYNGYSWDGKHRLYNPFSIVHLCHRLDFQNFWFQSGTPSLLIELIVQKAQQVPIGLKQQPEAYEGIELTEDVFDTAELQHLDVAGLMFQTGYLTISSIQRADFIKWYTLDYPNFEVKWSFAAQILAKYAQMPKAIIQSGAIRIKQALRLQKKEEFTRLLQGYFATIPYQLRQTANEAYYHSIFHMIFILMGIEILSERNLLTGRIDGILEFDDFIYIIEFKYSKKGTVKRLTKAAIRQIKAKGYAAAYHHKAKTIYLLGVGFLEKKETKKGGIKLEMDVIIETFRIENKE